MLIFYQKLNLYNYYKILLLSTGIRRHPFLTRTRNRRDQTLSQPLSHPRSHPRHTHVHNHKPIQNGVDSRVRFRRHNHSHSHPTDKAPAPNAGAKLGGWLLLASAALGPPASLPVPGSGGRHVLRDRKTTGAGERGQHPRHPQRR